MTSVSDDKSSECFEHHSADNLHDDLARRRREQLVFTALFAVARRHTAGFPRRHRRPGLTHRRQLVTVGRRFVAAASRLSRRAAAVRRRPFRVEVAQRQRDSLTWRDPDLPRTLHGAQAEVL